MRPEVKNLLIRTITGALIVILIVTALLWNSFLYCTLFGGIVIIMMNEYLRMTIGKKHLLAQLFTILIGAGLFIISFGYFAGEMDYKSLFFIPLLLVAIFITLLFDEDKDSYKLYPYLFGAIAYIALPFSLCNLIALDSSGTFNGITLLSLIVLLWSNDVGAYLIGMTFGQKNGHKLFPSISPKKSWEGFVGGILFALLGGFLLGKYLLPFGVTHSMIIAGLVSIFGTLGDLAESQLKRNFDVKDAGNLLPGHGGFLDRFDGALISFPVAISYIKLFGLI